MCSVSPSKAAINQLTITPEVAFFQARNFLSGYTSVATSQLNEPDVKEIRVFAAQRTASVMRRILTDGGSENSIGTAHASKRIWRLYLIDLLWMRQ